jgi:ribosomal-protein-serine acetyltransferase
MTICVEQARLEPLQNEHAPALFRCIDDHRNTLRQWLAWVDDHTTIDETVDFIGRSADQMAARDGMSLGLWTEGELIGVAGLHYVDWKDRATSVGFWLAPPFTGRGLMSKAVFGLMTLAFDEYGLQRFEGRAAIDNSRSRALFERLGFRHEGILRDAQLLPAGFVDHAVYSVVASEWPSMRERWPVEIDLVG